MKNERKNIWVVIIVVGVLLAVALSLPPVWSRVDYYSREVYRTVKYWLKPPSESVFVPSTYEEGFVSSSVSAIITADAPAPQPTTEPTTIPAQSTPEVDFSPTPTYPPTPPPTPPPPPPPFPSP